MAHINKLHYKENLKNVKSDVIAKGIFEDDKKHWTITSGQMKGKVGDLAFSFSKKEKTLFFGLGKKNEATAENFRRAAGSVVNFIIDKKYSSLAIECPTGGMEAYNCQAFTEGLILSSYRFLDYFSDERANYHLKNITMVGTCNKNASNKGATIANAVCDSRDLANHPGNVTTPTRLANFAKEVGKKGNMRVTVFNRDKFTKMGM
jgi:leucyl aminopeptidase